MLLFRSEQHVERWCRQWKMPVGGLLSPEQGWRLAVEWYGDRLEPDWRSKSLEQMEAWMKGLGLTSDFWRLRA